MTALMLLFLAPVLFALGAFFRGIFGSAFGALAGWFLSMTFLGTWALAAAASLGYTGDLVELGALLGFAGGFFASSSSSSTKNH